MNVRLRTCRMPSSADVSVPVKIPAQEHTNRKQQTRMGKGLSVRATNRLDCVRLVLLLPPPAIRLPSALWEGDVDNSMNVRG